MWEGPAVANTNVSVTVETTENGQTKSQNYRDDFDVEGRSWPTLQLKAPTVTIGLRGGMQAYPLNGLLGNAGPDLPESVFAALPVSRAPHGGPNAGLAYLTNPLPNPNHHIYLHPGLYPTPAGLQPGQPGYEGWHRWHDDQNGNGSGSCTQAVFNKLTAEAERHEGVTMAPNSHWGITQQFYQNQQPQRRIERLFTNGPDDVLRAQAWNEWTRLHNTGSHSSAQTNFDTSDYPAIYTSLGCTLDYNPNNQ